MVFIAIIIFLIIILILYIKYHIPDIPREIEPFNPRKLKPGDVLVIYHHGIISSLIRAIDGSPATHTAIIVDDKFGKPIDICGVCEKSVCEKSVCEKSVGAKSVGAKSVGEKSSVVESMDSREDNTLPPSLYVCDLGWRTWFSTDVNVEPLDKYLRRHHYIIGVLHADKPLNITRNIAPTCKFDLSISTMPLGTNRLVCTEFINKLLLTAGVDYFGKDLPTPADFYNHKNTRNYDVREYLANIQ